MVRFLMLLLACAVSLQVSAEKNAIKPEAVDTSFQFFSTNTPVINDLLLLPDGRIAFAGAGLVPWGLLNSNDSSNRTTYPHALETAASLLLSKEQAVLVAGAFQFDPPVIRLNGAFEDSAFLAQMSSSLVKGTAAKILIQNNDDDIIAAGKFTFSGQTNNVGLIRLKRNGQLDKSFNSQDSLGLSIIAAGTSTNGEILASYTFTNNAGQLSYGFGHWMADGSRDTNFTGEWLIAIGPDAHVTAIERAPDATNYLAAVEFIQGTATNAVLFTVSPAGLPVNSFHFPTINGSIRTIAFAPPQTIFGSDPYKQIILAGDFSEIGGISCNRLAVLSRDGVFQWGFADDEGPDGIINSVQVQPDGRILIGGAFKSISGVPANALARLEGLSAAGSTCVYWDITEYVAFNKLGAVEMALNRKGNETNVLSFAIEGDLESPPVGISLTKVVFGPGETRKVFSLPILTPPVNRTEFRLDVVPSLDEATPIAWNSIIYTPARLRFLDNRAPGTLDPTFESPISTYAWSMARQSDGKMLLGYWANGPHVLRMNTDDSIDASFYTNGIPATNTGSAYVTQIQAAPDGKIYAAGTFVTSSSFGTNLLVRLNSDGTLDTSFNPRLRESSVGGIVENPAAFALRPDGKVFVTQLYDRSSLFAHQQAQPTSIYPAPYRLNPDGTLDKTFIPRNVPAIYTMTTQGDGKLLAAGVPMGSLGASLYRYGETGLIDTNLAVRANSAIYELVMNGEFLLLGGPFSTLNGSPAAHMARVNLQSGTPDFAFSCETDGDVRRILVAQDGKIYIAGDFTRVNGKDRYRLARLKSDGSLNESYNPGMGFSEAPNIALQGDGRLLATSGAITTGPVNVDLMPMIGLVRLEGPGLPPEVHIFSPTNGTEFEITDAIGQFQIDTEALTPGGFLDHLVVELDGIPIATNQYSQLGMLQRIPAFPGQHQVRVVAVDESGFTGSAAVNFTVTQLPGPRPVKLSIEQRPTGIFVIYPDFRLQESQDLQTWSTVHNGTGTGTNEYKVPTDASSRFYRVRE